MDSAILYPTGSVGNIVSSAVGGLANDSIAFEFIVEAIGATPTVTVVIEQSNDGVNWRTTPKALATGGTAGTSFVYANTGSDFIYPVDTGFEKWAGFWRMRTSANTNVTFRAILWIRSRG